jgi:hypothetical protein
VKLNHYLVAEKKSEREEKSVPPDIPTAEMSNFRVQIPADMMHLQQGATLPAHVLKPLGPTDVALGCILIFFTYVIQWMLRKTRA